MKKKIIRQLDLDINDENAVEILQALASKPRVKILNLLGKSGLINISDISKELNIPLSTTILHINKLEKTGLIHTEIEGSSGGKQKLCNTIYSNIMVYMANLESQNKKNVLEIEMPIGAYSFCDISPTCGLVSEKKIIGNFDDPQSFYDPNRIRAQLLWFKKGYIEYVFPNKILQTTKCLSLSISMEICSEAPMYHDNWPSDITLWINDVEIGTWTSPSDFGGEKGLLTPIWWSTRNTQYGLLKEWKVTGKCSMIDVLVIYLVED